MERQCWANPQLSRRECLEVAGIPRDVSNENLESKALEVFSKVGCEILFSNIQSRHRLTNNEFNMDFVKYIKALLIFFNHLDLYFLQLELLVTNLLSF